MTGRDSRAGRRPPAESVPTGTRTRRLAGVVGLGVRRTLSRATGRDARRVWLGVAGVALAVALMVVVTGVAAGLATGTTVRADGVDYWIVPRDDTGSTVVESGPPQLGDAHGTSARLAADSRVEYATPVLTTVVRMRASGSTAPEYVLAVGVVPHAGMDDLSGVSTDSLSPGDPYHGSGDWSGDVVLSPAAAALLNASTGERLQVFTTDPSVAGRPLSVAGVADTGARAGQVPVALFRLSELQALTGAAAGDRADQLLVSTNAPGVRSALDSVYPDATVVSRTGLDADQVLDSSLPLAVGLTALVVALVVGTLFVATTMGLEVLADRRQLAVLAAVGFRDRDRALLVVVQTLCLTLVGGVAGLALGLTVAWSTNALAAAAVSSVPVVVLRPELAVYGLLVAVAIGLLAAPYPLLLLRRTTALSELGR